MHSERLLDHFRSPRNPGELAPPAIKVDVTNPACGDMMPGLTKNAQEFLTFLKSGRPASRVARSARA